MGLFDRIWSWRQRKASTLDYFKEVYGSAEVKSGQSVNYKTALEVTTVFACARVLAEGVSQVPLKLFRESPDGKSRLPATDHVLYSVLHRRPNDWQTSFEFRETMMMHLVLCGNFFAFKRRARGQIAGLLPIGNPGDVAIEQAKDFTLTYKVKGLDGQTQTFSAQDIWHVRGPSWNSWMGLEGVKLGREAIGLALATEEHHARLHRHGAKPGGLLSVEGTLTEEQYKNLKAWLESNYDGAGNSWRTMIMDHAAKFTQLAMTGVDSQHLETRRFQIEEICRLLRVMPIMAGFSDKASTYASAEQMFLSHVVHSLAPWYERIEQSIDANLLTNADREAGVYAKFIEEGLLRGDLKNTAEYLTKLSTNGIMTRNEARAKLDLNPIDGLDEPLTPVNMAIGTEPPAPDDEPNDKE